MEKRQHEAGIHYRECCTSTNSELKEMARQGAPHGSVLWASRQSAGRGRMGRSFDSPEGGLYFSILWRTKRRPEDCLCLTPSAAVALSRCIERHCGLSPEIKWPNDLLLGGKKLCGILTEGSFDSEGNFFVVLGFGLNVNNPVFSPELQDKATSLSLEAGRNFSIIELAAACDEALEEMYEDCFKNPELWLDEYRCRCSTIGASIKSPEGPAQVLGIGEDYSLILQRNGDIFRKAYGEIEII